MSAVWELTDALIGGGMHPADAAVLVARAAVEMSPVPSKPVRAGAVRMADYRDRREAMGMPRVFPADRYRPLLVSRDGERCVYCEAADQLVIDHIHPTFLGGDDDLGNLGLACRPCNGRKAGKPLQAAGMKIVVETAACAHEGYLSRTLCAENPVHQLTPIPRTTAHNRAHCAPNENALSLSKKESKQGKEEREPRKARASQIPDDWKPGENAWQAAIDRIGADRAITELKKFKNHAADKGRVSKRWDAAWQNWVDRALDYGGGMGTKGNSNGRRTVHDAARDLSANVAARLREFDEPAPELRDETGRTPLRLLPSR